MHPQKLIRNPKENCEVFVSSEEETFRNETYPNVDQIKKEALKCTACSASVSGKSLQLHSFLKVLVCKKCKNFYGDGDFSTDDEGDERYCRWCGEGGKMIYCDKCNSGFCEGCIVRNFNKDVLRGLRKSDKWDCYMCCPKPLFELRAKAWAAEKYFQGSRNSRTRTSLKESPNDKERERHCKGRKSGGAKAESEQKSVDKARRLIATSLNNTLKMTEEFSVKTMKIGKSKITRTFIKNRDDVRKYGQKVQGFYDSVIENIVEIKKSLATDLAAWEEIHAKTLDVQNEKKIEEKKDETDQGTKQPTKDNGGGECQQNNGENNEEKEIPEEKEEEKTVVKEERNCIDVEENSNKEEGIGKTCIDQKEEEEKAEEEEEKTNGDDNKEEGDVENGETDRDGDKDREMENGEKETDVSIDTTSNVSKSSDVENDDTKRGDDDETKREDNDREMTENGEKETDVSIDSTSNVSKSSDVENDDTKRGDDDETKRGDNDREMTENGEKETDESIDSTSNISKSSDVENDETKRRDNDGEMENGENETASKCRVSSDSDDISGEPLPKKIRMD